MLIKKRSDYKEHTCDLGLGGAKNAEFNKNKSVEVSDEQAGELLKFDWCIEVKGEKIETPKKGENKK